MPERVFNVNQGSPYAVCSGCGEAISVGGSSGHGRRLPPDAVSKFFRNKGWYISTTGKKDLCPTCAKPARKTKPKDTDMARDTTVVDIKPKLTGVSELPPREITREDRRIIFAKLEEVYLDETTGYLSGWNDELVSKDLNCPRKWVETIREENFGPAHAPENPQVIALREKIDSTMGMITEINAQTVNFKQRLDTMISEALTLNTRSNALLSQVQTLRDELKKITGR